MNLGANPQIGLLRGVEARSFPIVDSALKHGADPRRDGHAAIRNAEAAVVSARSHDPASDILVALRKAEQTLDQKDYVAFAAQSQQGLTVAGLRQRDEATGRSGLMIAAAAGAFDQALSAFKKENIALEESDLLTTDKGGDTALRLLCDRGQAALVVDKNLWLLRESSCRKVFEQMPEAVRQELSTLHNDTQNALQSHRIAVRLKEQADAHKRHFRLK
jgi:hypothetical protein